MKNNNDYATAPYNFIPFPKKVIYRHKIYEEDGKIVLKDLKGNYEDICHNSYKESKKTGYIKYIIDVKTPTFIGDGCDEFFEINGVPVIPGSTVRGKIRSTAEILSCAYPDFIEDSKPWDRGAFAKGIFKEKYMKVVKSVKAGYLIKVDKTYKIIAAQEDANGNSFKEIYESSLRALEKKVNDEIGSLLKENKLSFNPYYCSALYDKEGNILSIVRATDSEQYGVLMNSSNLNNKQRHYLIYKKDLQKSRIISNQVVSQFKTSMKYRHKEHFTEKFDLPEEEGKEKPVFYRLDNKGEIIAFGFTPYLKIPYNKSVCDGIKTFKDKDTSKIDYVQGLFGFSNLKCTINNREKEISYKGRVSFTNARLVDGEGFEAKIKKSLMEPKITSFQLYLNQPKTRDNIATKTYADDFELRGSKFYWLKDKADSTDKNKEEKTKHLSKLTPISEGSTFQGKVDFQNLSDDELGLLIMSIKPFNTAKDNIGQGKPYGFGKIEFSILEIKEIEIKNRFKSFSKISSIRKNLDVQIEDYKDCFKKYMKNSDEEINFKEGRWKSFYISKKEVNSKLEEFKYMNFEYEKNKKYKNRVVLKSMDEFIDENDNEKEDCELDLSKLLEKFNK